MHLARLEDAIFLIDLSWSHQLSAWPLIPLGELGGRGEGGNTDIFPFKFPALFLSIKGQ